MTGATGIILCDDLLFASRVSATAAAHQLKVDQVRDAAVFLSRIAVNRPSCVFVDLQCSGLDLPIVVTQAHNLSPPARIIAFGSHVDAATLSAARQSGCDLVLPRSAFAEQLEAKLVQWLTCSSETSAGQNLLADYA